MSIRFSQSLFDADAVNNVCEMPGDRVFSSDFFHSIFICQHEIFTIRML